MAQKHNPYENTITEKINSVLKYKYALKLIIKNTKILFEV